MLCFVAGKRFASPIKPGLRKERAKQRDERREMMSTASLGAAGSSNTSSLTSSVRSSDPTTYAHSNNW